MKLNDLVALARFDGFPRSDREASWDGRLADACAERLEAEIAASRHRAAVLWAEHGLSLREAGKEPWFLVGPPPAVRSDGRVPCSVCRRRKLFVFDDGRCGPCHRLAVAS